MGEKRLKKALNQAGYTYSNKAPKGWSFSGEGTGPLDHNIFNYVNSDSPEVWKKVEIPSTVQSDPHENEINVQLDSPRPKSTGESVVKSISQEGYSKLMYEELKAIRGLLQPNQSHVNRVSPSSLLDRIVGLDRDAEKTRKTIVINEEVAKQLDDFSKKKRINKSDLIELALLDLFERYR
jgi:hypothetical protein